MGTCGLSTYLSVTDRDRLQVTPHLLPYTTGSGYAEFILYGVLVDREGHILSGCKAKCQNFLDNVVFRIFIYVFY